MSAPIATAPAARSTFVTVLAWIFIGLSSLSVLISILQNVMVHLMFRGPQFEQAMQQAKATPQTPAFAGFMFEYMWVLFALSLLVSIAALAASIGLLRRRNWARLLFIALMALGIVWNIAGFILQLGMFPSPAEMPGAPADFDQHFRTIFIAIMVFGALMAIAFSVLFGWIIKRLLSPQIAAEFVAPNRITHVG